MSEKSKTFGLEEAQRALRQVAVSEQIDHDAKVAAAEEDSSATDEVDFDIIDVIMVQDHDDNLPYVPLCQVLTCLFQNDKKLKTAITFVFSQTIEDHCRKENESK